MNKINYAWSQIKSNFPVIYLGSLAASAVLYPGCSLYFFGITHLPLAAVMRDSKVACVSIVISTATTFLSLNCLKLLEYPTSDTLLSICMEDIKPKLIVAAASATLAGAIYLGYRYGLWGQQPAAMLQQPIEVFEPAVAGGETFGQRFRKISQDSVCR